MASPTAQVATSRGGGRPAGVASQPPAVAGVVVVEGQPPPSCPKPSKSLRIHLIPPGWDPPPQARVARPGADGRSCASRPPRRADPQPHAARRGVAGGQEGGRARPVIGIGAGARGYPSPSPGPAPCDPLLRRAGRGVCTPNVVGRAAPPSSERGCNQNRPAQPRGCRTWPGSRSSVGHWGQNTGVGQCGGPGRAALARHLGGPEPWLPTRPAVCVGGWVPAEPTWPSRRRPPASPT
jgi:hypothetical protein